ncbi:MAG: aldehyde dehydrogenase [Novosphingobium sp.]|nr:aldehyde dehydrogenase [Novosphingobium sp.]
MDTVKDKLFDGCDLDAIFVGGSWQKPSSAERIEVVNPATEEVFFTVPAAQVADVERVVAAARLAFDKGPWPRMSPAERAPYLLAIAERVRARQDELAAVWSRQMGVTQAGASLFLEMVPDQIADYGRMANTFQFEEAFRDTGAGAITLLTHEPVGVVAAVIPWNAPMTQIAFKAAPALLAGCCVILKASPEAPGEAYIMASICKEVGLPDGVFNVITADRDVSEMLVRHPGVDKVSFTGSSAVGKRIASICGERVARYTLELGGKSAAIICDDFDIDQAADIIAGAAPLLTGQVCASLTRLLVNERQHDRFVEALGTRFKDIHVGDPADPAVAMGPLASRAQRERVETYIAQGIEGGAALACGGGRPSHLPRGYFVQPTIFGHVSPSAAIAREEIFGPVVSVIPFRSEEQAIEIANDSPYGLNASVFTNDVEKAYRTARQLRSGTVGQNGFKLDFKVAFGGFKESGVGRECGTEGLRAYLEPKTIILTDVPGHHRT